MSHPIGLALCVSLLGLAALPSPVSSPRAEANPGNRAVRLPLVFERAQAETAREGEFVALGGRGTIGVRPDRLTFTVQRTDGRRHQVRKRLLGARPGARLSPGRRLAVRTHYFTGSDPRRWRRDVPGYAAVRAREVYPGIDVVHYSNAAGELEEDFVVAPGRDPGCIAAVFEGAERADAPVVDAAGDLVVGTDAGELRQRRPVAYQEVGGRRRPVSCEYRVTDGEVRFALGEYDRSRELVIDPVLDYESYFEVVPTALAVDSTGKVYLAGSVGTSPQVDVLVAKLDPSLTGAAQLLYRTVFGGNNGNPVDAPRDLAVDSSFNVWVVGQTGAFNFPIDPAKNPFQTAMDGLSACFIARLSPSGVLDYSTYVTVNGHAGAQSVALTSDGLVISVATNAGDAPIIVGPADFPVTRHGPTGGTSDVMVVRLKDLGVLTDPSPADGYNQTNLVYGALVGGTLNDLPGEIALDAAGRPWVTGITLSSNFPVTLNAAQATTAGGGSDACLIGLSADGTTLDYATYLGGSGGEFSGQLAGAVAVDPGGRVYMAGFTSSGDFPDTAGAFQAALGGSSDGFVAVIDPAASPSLAYASYLGGSGGDGLSAIALCSCGRIHLAGSTGSTDAPTAGPLQAVLAGTGDAYLAIMDLTRSGSEQLVFGTYFGGSGADAASLLALAPTGQDWIAGPTASTDLPRKNPLLNTAAPGFLARIDPFGSAGPPGKLKLTPAKISFGNTQVGRVSTKILRIKNIGTGALQVTTGTLAAPFSLSAPGETFTLTRNQQRAISVRFTPTAAGPQTGVLRVTSSDPARGLVDIQLKGSGRARR